MEYRTLSSYFSGNEKLIKWCFGQTKRVIDFVNSDKSYLIANRGDEIMNIINNEDKEKAQELVKEFELELV